MTEILRPMQRLSDKRWEMTWGTDERTGEEHAIGYCRGWREAEEFEPAIAYLGHDYAEIIRKEIEASRPFKDKYHVDGHDTAEQAFACWHAHLVDQKLEFVDQFDRQEKCVECGCWTLGRARFRGGSLSEYVLCYDHQTRETVEKLLARKRSAS